MRTPAAAALVLLTACGGPPAHVEVDPRNDACAWCRMGVSDLRTAAQLVTIDGTIYAVGTNAVPGNAGAQGGGGGSVRVAGTLVEGTGVIDTSGGTGAVDGADGPIEIQAFVEDVFAGTATGTTRSTSATARRPWSWR